MVRFRPHLGIVFPITTRSSTQSNKSITKRKHQKFKLLLDKFMIFLTHRIPGWRWQHSKRTRAVQTDGGFREINACMSIVNGLDMFSWTKECSFPCFCLWSNKRNISHWSFIFLICFITYTLETVNPVSISLQQLNSLLFCQIFPQMPVKIKQKRFNSKKIAFCFVIKFYTGYIRCPDNFAKI